MTPQATDPDGLRDALAGALPVADIAAVLLRLPAADDRTLINRVKALAPAVQDKGAALLLDGHAEIVARAAPMARISPVSTHSMPRSAGLKPERIAGCGGLNSRHDAMRAARPGPTTSCSGSRTPPAAGPRSRRSPSRVAWWAEVFEAPCVGFAGSLDEVEMLAGAGADFVALGDWAWSDPQGCAGTVAEAGGTAARDREPVA